MPDNAPGNSTLVAEEPSVVPEESSVVNPAKAFFTDKFILPDNVLVGAYLVPANPNAFPFPLVFLSFDIVDPDTKTFLDMFASLLAKLSASAISSALFPPSIPSNRS